MIYKGNIPILTVNDTTGETMVTLTPLQQSLGLVYEGIDLCKKEKVDFLLAVGGEKGSAKVLNEEAMLAIY